MPSVLKTVRNTASGLTRQGALYAGNAFDRVFRAASLVQAGQTPFETLHSDGLVSLRYYPPLQEDFIELDGMVIPVERKTHRTPIVIIPPRSEEHTSELQSRPHLVCRLLLEKKKPDGALP